MIFKHSRTVALAPVGVTALASSAAVQASKAPCCADDGANLFVPEAEWWALAQGAGKAIRVRKIQ